MAFITWNPSFGWPELALGMTSFMAYRLTKALLRLEQKRSSDEEYRFIHDKVLHIFNQAVLAMSMVDANSRIPDSTLLEFYRLPLLVKSVHGEGSPAHKHTLSLLPILHKYKNALRIIDSHTYYLFLNKKCDLQDLRLIGCQYYTLAKTGEHSQLYDGLPIEYITDDDLQKSSDIIDECKNWVKSNQTTTLNTLASPLLRENK